MNIQTKHIINSLPLVADVLGSKYGISVVIGGDSASTNGKTIFLPSLPLDSGHDVLNTARGYIDHESAHLRHTDFDILNASKLTPVEKFLWNVLEDHRVERELANIFPGCRTNLQWLCRNYLLGEGETGRDSAKNPALLILEWALLYVRSRDVSEFAAVRERSAQKLDRYFPALRSELETVLDVAVTSANTQECIDAARELARIIAAYASTEADMPDREKDSGNSSAPSENGSADVAPSEGQTGEDGEHEEQGDAGQQEEESEVGEKDAQHADSEEHIQDTARQDMPGGREQSVSRNKTNGHDTASAAQKIQELLADPNPRLPKDLGETLRNALQARHHQGGEQLSVAVPVVACNLPFSEQELMETRQATTALRTRLQAFLQSEVAVRNRNSRAGHVNAKRLARLSVNDPRVFMQKGRRRGMNTSVHILLDSSSSMEGPPITLACKACYAAASALVEIHGVGVAVTAFPGQRGGGTVAPVLKRRERLHTQFLVRAQGGTPMASALWWVAQQLHRLQDERKIILLITDGEANSVPQARNALKAATDCGLEVYGIGIRTESVRKLLPEEFCRSITALNELAPAMFGILQSALTRTHRIT
jgi:cobalamin biosynthesis protein CobT